jgi:hypothetical protein
VGLMLGTVDHHRLLVHLGFVLWVSTWKHGHLRSNGHGFDPVPRFLLPSHRVTL